MKLKLEDIDTSKYSIAEGKLVNSYDPPGFTDWDLDAWKELDELKVKFLPVAERAIIEAMTEVLQEKYKAQAFIGIKNPRKIEVGFPFGSFPENFLDYEFDLEEMVRWFITVSDGELGERRAMRDELRRLAQIIDDAGEWNGDGAADPAVSEPND